LQLFATLAIAVIAAAVTAAIIAFHVFDRELERAHLARLEMLVAETGRVMDAGITAGLDLDRPQLQGRAIRHLRGNLAGHELIAVVDATGRIVASSSPAEIGELITLDTLGSPVAATPNEAGERTVVVRPIQSLFGAPAGWVTARLGASALDEPRRAFIAKLSLATAAVALAGLVVAGLAAAFLPWRARHVARGIERHMAALYAGIGKARSRPAIPGRLPAPMARALERFSLAVETRQHELRSRADAVDVLDEAA
jgi:hypothetical protein